MVQLKISLGNVVLLENGIVLGNQPAEDQEGDQGRDWMRSGDQDGPFPSEKETQEMLT